MKELRGKTAVVTGAASGIGFALAERFAEEGMNVVLADIERAALDRALEKLGAGGRLLGVATDVADPESVEALAQKAEAAFGKVHVVCNNAGVGTGGPCWEQSLEDWRWVLGVNLWGVIHGIRCFVPRILAHGEGGHIVNTASVAGLLSPPFMSIYCATKHAVVAISECLHHELSLSAGNVHASVLCPAWVKTKIADAERNRPARLPAAAGPTDQRVDMMQAILRQAVETGMDPRDVADRVVTAIREEQFWILTHGKVKGAVSKRTEGIVAETNPETSFDL